MMSVGLKTILLVEDEAIIALGVTMTLKKFGFDVIVATNGEKAVEAADGHPDIGLILMDINLGKGMDGTEAARAILRKRELPIVFHSSHTEPEVVEKTEGISSYGYIVKNSGETVLLASIKMAFRLWASEEKFRGAFENVATGMVLTAPDGRFIQANEAFCAMLGYERDELPADNFSAFTHPDDKALSMERIKSLLSGLEKRSRFSKRYIHKDGHTVWADLSTVLLRDEAGAPQHFITHVQDISERRVHLEYLNQFRNIISSTADGIALLDREYRYKIVNKAYETFSGRKAESLIGLSVNEYLGNDFFLSEVKPHFDRCLAGESVRYEAWIDYPTLGRRYVQVSYFPYYGEGQAVEGVVANTRDMSGERFMAERLQHSMEQYDLLLRSAPVAILVMQEGRYVYCNPYGARLLGYAIPDELVGTPVLDTVAEESRNAVAPRIARVAGGEENPPITMFLLRRDGSKIKSESISIPIIFDQNPAALIIGRELVER
jgi:PAS domain S-box-containing protein